MPFRNCNKDSESALLLTIVFSFQLLNSKIKICFYLKIQYCDDMGKSRKHANSTRPLKALTFMNHRRRRAEKVTHLFRCNFKLKVWAFLMCNNLQITNYISLSRMFLSFLRRSVHTNQLRLFATINWMNTNFNVLKSALLKW